MMKHLSLILPALLLPVALLCGPAQAQYITSPVTEAARNAPTGRLTPPPSDEVSGDRVQALELRLARMEQLLEAQRNLQARQNRSEAMKLRQRLDLLESQLASMAASGGNAEATAPSNKSAPTPAVNAPGATQPAVVPTAIGAVTAQTRLNDMAETLRLLQAQTDQLMIEMRGLTQRVNRGQADSEFRFQALESGVRRANAGISSVSSEPEVIGFVKRAAPVEGLESASATTATNAAATKLVGEGDLSALDDFAAVNRPQLSDPKKLYERGLKDLRGGDYAGAQADFAQVLQNFPNHELAGNAQYWLGETFYVRRQYKQAAQAFLAGYTTYEASAKAPDSLLKLGMTLTALGEKKTGCDAFAELGAKFPDAPNAVTKRADIERKRAGCAS
ncbi:MAG: tol-pal system protein YbgF [Parvibaculales bacterium]